MGDIPVWKDDFSKVAPEGSLVGQTRSGLARLWEVDLILLRANGFAEWLEGTFGGARRNYDFRRGKGANFVFPDYPHTETPLFCSAFTMVTPEFKPEAVGIAQEGLKKMVAAIDTDIISYEGVYELVEVAAALGLRKEFEKLVPLLPEKEATFLATQGQGVSPPQPANQQ